MRGSWIVWGTWLVVFPCFLTLTGRSTPRAGTATPLRARTRPSSRTPALSNWTNSRSGSDRPWKTALADFNYCHKSFLRPAVPCVTYDLSQKIQVGISNCATPPSFQLRKLCLELVIRLRQLKKGDNDNCRLHLWEL